MVAGKALMPLFMVAVMPQEQWVSLNFTTVKKSVFAIHTRMTERQTGSANNISRKLKNEFLLIKSWVFLQGEHVGMGTCTARGMEPTLQL